MNEEKVVLTYSELESLKEEWAQFGLRENQKANQLASQNLELEQVAKSYQEQLAAYEQMLLLYRELSEEITSKYRPMFQDNDPVWLAEITALNMQVSL